MSPWMPDGNIVQYTKMNPDVNRLMLVRSINLKIDENNLLTCPQQLAQVCRGLMFLHRLGVLHGGITPVSKIKERAGGHINPRHVQNNILSTRDGQACLGDFGVIIAFRDVASHNYKVETLRYMAPERFRETPPGFR